MLFEKTNIWGNKRHLIQSHHFCSEIEHFFLDFEYHLAPEKQNLWSLTEHKDTCVC